jgi:hypothetical protein
MCHRFARPYPELDNLRAIGNDALGFMVLANLPAPAARSFQLFMAYPLDYVASELLPR